MPSPPPSRADLHRDSWAPPRWDGCRRRRRRCCRRRGTVAAQLPADQDGGQRRAARRYACCLSHDCPPSARQSRQAPTACGGSGLSSFLVDRVQAAQQQGFRIGRRDEAVGGRGERASAVGFDQIGADQHHQFGLVVLEVAAAEQRAQHRQVLHAGKAVDHLLGVVLHQAGDGEAAAGRQFDRGLGAAHRQGRDGQPPVVTVPLTARAASR